MMLSDFLRWLSISFLFPFWEIFLLFFFLFWLLLFHLFHILFISFFLRAREISGVISEVISHHLSCVYIKKMTSDGKVIEISSCFIDGERLDSVQNRYFVKEGMTSLSSHQGVWRDKGYNPRCHGDNLPPPS